MPTKIGDSSNQDSSSFDSSIEAILNIAVNIKSVQTSVAEEDNSVQTQPHNTTIISQVQRDMTGKDNSLKTRLYNSSNTPTSNNARFIDVGDGITIPKEFIPSLKNPCWYENDSSHTEILRCLPYFYLLGVAKSGTTDLHDTLIRHPLILRAKLKEPKWITMHHFRKQTFPFVDYLSFFQEATEKLGAYANQPNHAESGAVVGDFSPDTFFKWHIADEYIKSKQGKLPYTNIPELLFLINRKAKLLVSLRDPITRLLSEFHMMHGDKMTPQWFHTDVNHSLWMWKSCVTRQSELGCIKAPLDYNPNNWNFIRFPRIQVGLYHLYFKEWFKVFPREQFLIVKFEEYRRNRRPVVNSILDFLDLHYDGGDNFFEHINGNGRPGKPYPHMLPETHKMLHDFYKPHNEQLARLLNDSYFYWNNA